MIPLLLALALQDEAGVRAAVEKFLEAVGKGDAAAAAALWAPEARESLGPLEKPSEAPREIKVHHFTFDGDDASARIDFLGRLLPGDAAYADEARTYWWADFRREGGRWLWTARVPAVAVVASRLETEPDPAERLAELKRHPELAGERLVQSFCTAAVQLGTGGDPAEAMRLSTLAVEIADFTKRADLRCLALLHQGICVATQKRPGEALPILRKAMGLAEGLPELAWRALVGAWLGFALSDANRTDEALAELRKALEHAEKGDLREERIQVLKFLGMVHLRRGELKEAVRRQEEAVARSVGPELIEERVQSLHELSNALWQVGDFGAALKAAYEGLRIAEAPDQAPNRAKLLNALGLIYLSSGQLEKALARLEEALELWTTLGLPRLTGTLLSNIGETLRQLGRLPEAVERFEAALKVLGEFGDRPNAIAARNNLALVHRMREDFDRALEQYRLCEKEAAEIGSPATLALAHCNVADVLCAKGDAAGAAEAILKAAPLAKASGSVSILFTLEYTMARIARLRGGPGDLAASVAALRRAAALLERSRGGLRDPALQQSFLSKHAPLFYVLADTLLARGQPAEAFAAAEEGKARTLMDLFGAGEQRLVKSMSPEERAEEARLEARLRELDARLSAAVLSDEREKAEAELGRAREALEEFRRGVFVRHPELESLRGRFKPAGLRELNRRLLAGPPKTALLSYLLGPSEVLLFVLSPGEETAAIQVVRIETTPEALKEKVDAFWTECSRAGGDYGVPGRALYALLVAPAEKALKDVEHVVLVPDGLLHGLPFQAIQDPSGAHLAEKWSLSLAPSATALLRMEDTAARRREAGAEGLSPLLAVGAPLMPPGFADLEHAKRELEALSRAYKVEPLLGEAATETRAKEALGKARRIHVSTHGKVNEASPLYSFVVLGADGANDGLLHAREIADLDLKADLVALSACETALGRQVAGEGVVGLTWSLFAAGAPATLLSQWQVDDESTREFMEAFHAAIRPGVPFAAALRQARLGMLKDPKRAHPYYWAPFVLVGAGRGS